MKQLFPHCRLIWLCTCLLSIQIIAKAQVNISSVPFSYTQDFNSLVTSGEATWTNNITVPGWYAQSSVTTTAVANALSTVKASNGSDDAVGIKSYGNSATDLDRSLGVVGSSNRAFFLGVRLKNTTGAAVRHLILSFDAKQWSNLHNKQASLVVSYSKDATSLTNGTWTEVPALQANAVSNANTGTVDGNSSANIHSVGQYPLANLDVQANDEVFIRWTVVYDNGSNKEEYLAIDNVKIEGRNDLVFYSRPTGDLYALSSWSSTPDYKGFVPLSFTAPGLQFVITRNNAALTKVFNLDESSKLIVGDGVAEASLSIPGAYVPRGMVDVHDYGTLYINTNAVPNFGVLHPLSTIVYGTSSTTEIPTATYGNLEIKGGNVKTLKSKTIVRGHLKMSEGGKLDLGNNDLIMADHKKFSAADANSYIQFKASNKGRVRVALKAGESSSIPVGTSSYTPITLALTAGATDTFSVRIIDFAYNSFDSNDNPTSLPRERSVVNKTWFIQEGVKGGSTMSVTLKWAPSDTLVGFKPDSTYLAHYENGAWDKGTSQKVTLINGMYSITRTGFTSFSPFDVESASASSETPTGPLPVTLVSFTGRYSNKTGVTLDWSTASEKDNDYFTVERSIDGKNFTSVGRVKGSGNSSLVIKYQFVDGQPLNGTAYYRLRQVDFDGRFETSKVIAVNGQGGALAVGSLKAYPNPTTGKVTLEVGRGQGGTAKIKVLNNTGQTLSSQQEMMLEGQTVEIDLTRQRAGMYYLQIENGAGRSIFRIVRQ